MDWLDKLPVIVGTIKQTARVLFFASCLLLFLPQKYLALIGVGNFVSTYRQWIGILFLVSFLFVLGDIFNLAGKLIVNIIDHNQSKKKLHNLTDEEKALLSQYIYTRTKTQKLSPMSGVVSGLVSANVIYQASRYGELLRGNDYNMEEWAWDYLQKNKHLLK